MNKPCFSTVALLVFGLSGSAGAQAPGTGGSAPTPIGPKGAPVPGMESHARMSPEAFVKQAELMQLRMSEQAAKLAARLSQLREKAKQARAANNVADAEQLEQAAASLEKGPLARAASHDIATLRHIKLMRLSALLRRYGARMMTPEVRAEFTTHAWRVARLQRMRTLAQTYPTVQVREKMGQRINALLKKENLRHSDALRALLPDDTSATPPSSSGDTATVPPGPGPSPTRPANSTQENK